MVETESIGWRVALGSPSSPLGAWGRRAALVALIATLVTLSPAANIVRAQDSTWVQMEPSSAPSSRIGQAMAYDSESDRVILFGGETSPGSNRMNGETWAYDLNSDTWENRNPSSGPRARFAHGMAYDSNRDRVLLFGGGMEMGPSTETWAYDYEANTWTDVSPPTPSPPAAVFVDLAYDAESDVTILFGGSITREGAFRGETWAYDLDSSVWTQRNPVDSPSPRAINGMMTYDPGVDRIVLFGGFQTLGDTWEYDYNTDTWTETSPETSPSPRHAGAMAYDVSRGRVILFGGLGAIAVDDTWLYDAVNDTWALVGSGNGPSSRYAPGLAYDTESEASVLFGGSVGARETWSHHFVSPPPPPIWAYVAIGVAIGAAVVVVAFIVLQRRKGKPGT